MVIMYFTDFDEKITDHKFAVGLSGALDCSVKMWNLSNGKLSSLLLPL